MPGYISGLFYDPTAPTLGDIVGTYSLGKTGNVITSTTVGGAEAMDVNLVSTISVDLNGVYDVSLNPNPDTVGIIVYTRAATPGAAQQTQRTTGGNAAATLTPANVQGIDTQAILYAYDGTTYSRVTMLDTRLSVEETYGSFTIDNKSPSTTAANIITTPLALRKLVTVINRGNVSIFIGPDNTVTAATGFEIAARTGYEFKFRQAVNIFALTSSSTTDIRIIQAA